MAEDRVWIDKDIRMSKMNANTAASSLINSFVQCGAFSPKNVKDGFKIFEEYRKKIFDYVYPDAPIQAKQVVEDHNGDSPPTFPYACEKCGKMNVTDGVKDFCEQHYDGHVYCMDCQKGIGKK